MARTAPVSSGGDFERPEPGVHVARLTHCIDLGTQVTTFNNEEKRQRKAILGWTMMDMDPGEDGRRPVVWERMTWSMSGKANLRKRLEAVRGKPWSDEEAARVDIYALAEKQIPAQLQIVNEEKAGKTYTNITAAMSVPKGLTVPPTEQSSVLFDLDAPDMEVFATFSDRLKETISASPEYQDYGRIKPAAKPVEDGYADDIGF